MYIKDRVASVSVSFSPNEGLTFAINWKNGKKPRSVPNELDTYCLRQIEKKFSGSHLSPIILEMIEHEIVYILTDAELMGRIRYDSVEDSYNWLN